MKNKRSKPLVKGIAKASTGIRGLDEITGGGLPAGRPTLLCGGAGAGKSLFAMQFLVHGALREKEPGVFVAFEETAEELEVNVASLGFNVGGLIARRKLVIDHVKVERNEIEETGEYDLDGLFVRLGYAIDSIGAKRVVLDTLESLFAALPNEAILRAELRRLFRWLKDKGVTAMITAERGDKNLTRYGLEEYVSDCVILLDHRVVDQISTRRLRVLKYRGTSHGTNEYPFLIDSSGITVLPITSVGLVHKASRERVSTGIPRLDGMLGGQGFYRGSSVLVSGAAGSGKSSIAASIADAACRRGERCLYFAFEESSDQVIRNMRSIGIDLKPWMDKGLLRFHAARPMAYGLETHLATMHKVIDDFRPHVAVVDPVSSLIPAGAPIEVQSALMRLTDFLKVRGTTSLFTNLDHEDAAEQTDVGISSVMDTWILVRYIENTGERNRGISVLKSRGMSHSNQIREFKLTGKGILLTDVYVGPAGVLTGSARVAQEARERAEALAFGQEIERRQRELEQKRKAVEAQIAALKIEFESEEEELARIIRQNQMRGEVAAEDRSRMGEVRGGDNLPTGSSAGRTNRKPRASGNGKGRTR